MRKTLPQREHKITIYQQVDDGWIVFATGRGTAADDATRADVVQGLTAFVQKVVRGSNVPGKERPLLERVIGSITVPPFGEVAVNGFGTEMVAEH